MRKNKHKKKYILMLLLLLFAVLFFFSKQSGRPQTAYADEDAGEELTQRVDDILGELDLSELENYYQTLNADQKAFFGGSITEYVEKIIKGELSFSYSNFFSYLLSAVGSGFINTLPMLVSIVVIAILVSLIGGLKGGFASESVEDIINFAAIGLTAVLVLVNAFTAIRSTAQFVTSLKNQMEAVFPIIFTLMTAIGASGSVKVYQPAVAAIGLSVVELITVVALPLIIITLVFSVIGNLSGTVKLKGMTKFFSSTSKWILYATFFLFIAFLSVQGVTASVYDNVSIRTAKFAISKYVPVIGGYLSEGFNVIAAGSVLIKNAVGLTAIVLLLFSALPILINVVLILLTLKLAAALIEPFSKDRISGMLGAVSESMGVLSAVIIGVTFLYFIFLILIIASANLAL